MKRVIAYISLALLITIEMSAGAKLPSAAPEAVGVSEAKLSKVDQVLQKAVDDGEVAGVVVIAARKGKVFYHKAFGQQNMESRTPMENDSIFRIYSMTKAITTTAAMMLREQGKFDLEDPVSQYIPSFASLSVFDGENSRPAKNQIKVVDLMRHTSGIGYNAPGKFSEEWNETDPLNREHTLEEFVDLVSKLPLHNEPSTEWQYGASIDVLARLVEVWSGKSFQNFVRTNILQPLGMVDTDFYVPASKTSRFTTNYDKSKDGLLTVGDTPATSDFLTLPNLYPGGHGLCSTATDYMKFLVMLERGGTLFGHQFLKKATVDLMLENHLQDELMPIRFGKEKRWGVGFGLGFNIRVEENTRWDSVAKKGEFGWGGAASTHYWASRDHELCVVTLEQVGPYNFLTEDRLKGLFYDAVNE